MSWRIGADVGGTFTDVAVIDERTGEISIAKVPTTPRQIETGVVEGVTAGLRDKKMEGNPVSLLSHATTVVTNALLEGKGSRAGFIATRGFRDILEIRRGSRSDLYDLFQDGPAVLVPRRHRFEVTERIDAQGAVVVPLAEDELDPIIDAIRAAGLETIAVSFLFSFLNDTHERRVGEILRKALPDVTVYLSSEVLPEIKEFERASTTAVCAYVGPVLGAYLTKLERATTAMGLPPLHIMGSGGGVCDVAEALRMPAACVESGPAAGVMAALIATRQLGVPNAISFDMGGTTAKASVIVDGEIGYTSEYEVGGAGHTKRWMNGTGHPIRVPVVDLAEVSSGGGSIAWLDEGGALKVGPRSAGSEPGPACYGKGGTLATVTDANVVLGYLNPRSLLDGDLKMDFKAASEAIRVHLAEPMGISVLSAAARVNEVVNSSMVNALRMVTVERGNDPQEFALMAFGGAGPIHAVALAEELKLPEVIIPPVPGAFSALGLVATDLRRDYSRTLYSDLKSVDPAEVEGAFAEMEERAAVMLDTAQVAALQREFVRSADVRYRRQAYELTVPFDGDGPVSGAMLERLAQKFHSQHEKTYGHSNEDEPVQLVNLRLKALGKLPALRLKQNTGGGKAKGATRKTWFPRTGEIASTVLWRDALTIGEVIEGPAIIESLDSTIVIPPTWAGEVEPNGYIRIRRV